MKRLVRVLALQEGSAVMALVHLGQDLLMALVFR
jgi:hypothetical protein